MAEESNFYREIADVPELPADLYPQIERKIIRRSMLRKSVYAVAASVILVIGTLTIRTQPSVNNTVQPEVASELQIIQDYLNSSDLESDLDLYAVVEGY